MTLRARPPTGHVAYPLILVEGEEKGGKSAVSYRLSASPKVGRTWVLDLGEGTSDEYKHLGPYEVLDHDGTFSDVYGQLRAATLEPQVEGRPNVIVLDDGTNLWALLKDWADARARRSTRGQAALKKDPDAEVDVPMNLWTDANGRWGQVVNLLRNWDGIGIICAQGREVAKVENGKPVANQTEWKVDAQKGTAAAATAWVRMSRPHTATLIAVRSFTVEVPAKGLVLPEDPPGGPLEHLVFGVLGVGGFGSSSRVQGSLADMTAEDRGETPDPDEIARASGWESAALRVKAWHDVLADLDPTVLRRLRLWKVENARGSTAEAHAATVAAREWLVAHRQAQVERGEEPFDTPVEVEGSDREAVDAYVRSLAEEAPDGAALLPGPDLAEDGQQDPDPGRPFEEGAG